MTVMDAGASIALPIPEGTQGRFIDQKRTECGLLIGTTLEVVRQLTGRDLLREILDPIAGDFDAVSAMQQGWGHLARAGTEVEQQWAVLSRGLEPGWSGLAADRAGETMAGEQRRAALRSRAAGLIGEQLGHLVEVARSTTNLVCAALAFVDTLVQDLIKDALLGPVGGLRQLWKAKARIQRLIRLIDRAAEAVEDLLRAAVIVTRALQKVQASMEAATEVTRGAGTVAHAVAGSYTDETASRGYAP